MIKRYNIDTWFDESDWAYSSDVEVEECEQGDWCKYEDYENEIKSLKQEKEELKERFLNEFLKWAKNKRIDSEGYRDKEYGLGRKSLCEDIEYFIEEFKEDNNLQ